MIPLVDIRCGYTVTELAAEMERSERTIRRWIADYQIHPVGRSLGGHRYLLAEFIAAEYVAREKRRVTLLGRFGDGVS